MGTHGHVYALHAWLGSVCTSMAEDPETINPKPKTQNPKH